jgi:hypothetical protein
MAKNTAPKDAQLKLRVDEDLKKRLDASASLNGTTLNAEVNMRLQKSYDAVGGEPGSIAGFLFVLKEAMNAAGKGALFDLCRSWRLVDQQSWLDNPYAYGRAREAAEYFFDALAPEGVKHKPKDAPGWEYWAEFVLDQAASGTIRGPESDNPVLQEYASTLNRSLGPLAKRLSNRRVKS